MRADEKQLEGPELEREVGLEVEEVQEEEEEMPILSVEQTKDAELMHRGRLFDAIQLILADEKLNISLLYLPQREANALEFLQAAVTGEDTMGEFVFAEDRGVLLEQALAVLQTNLTQGDQEQLTELHAKFDQLSERVATLRAELLSLEDAQDDLFDEKRQYVEEQTDEPDEADPADKGEPEVSDSITDFLASALTALADVAPGKALEGPETPDKVTPPSTLVGAAVPEKKLGPTTLLGPEVPDLVTAPSTLVGASIPEKKPQPTTLLEPEVHPEPKVSTLAEPPPAAPRTITPPTRDKPAKQAKGSKKRG